MPAGLPQRGGRVAAGLRLTWSRPANIGGSVRSAVAWIHATG